MSALAYSSSHVPLVRSRLHRHERILHRVLFRRRVRERLHFCLKLFKVVGSSLLYLLEGQELVRHVGPGLRPKRRHEFERINYYPSRHF